MKNIFSAWERAEKYFFLAFVILHTLPLFLLRYFVTHDGPGHLYNSNLINSLVFNSHAPASAIFEFTPGLVPNWLGHGLLCLFNIFFEAGAAEKLFQVLYVVTLCYSFRLLVTGIGGESSVSWLIFPFIYSFTFHLGFYSFSIGISLLFLTIWYWWNRRYNLNGGTLIRIFLLGMALYLCHLFIFFTAFCVVLFFYFWERWVASKRDPANEISNPAFLKNAGLFLVSVSIPLVLSLLFVVGNSSDSQLEMPVFAHVTEWFTDVRPIVTLDYDQDKVYSKPLFYSYIPLFLSSLIPKFSRRKAGAGMSDGWLVLAVIMTLLFFFVPDNLISGGHIGIRFCLLAYFFLFLFFAASASRWLLVACGWFSAVVALLMISNRFESLKGVSDVTASYVTCASRIREGATLLTLNYADNWMLNNISNYIGSEKEILVLDNYEASQVHFPLRWKEGMDPNKIIGTFALSRRPCVDLSAYSRQVHVQTDYVLVMEKFNEADDSCTHSSNRQLMENYKPVYTIPGNRGILYERVPTGTPALIHPRQ